MKDLLAQIEQLGATRINLYIWGESGTGKELVARAIHNTSDRASKPFRAINCNNFRTTWLNRSFLGIGEVPLQGQIATRRVFWSW